MLALLAMAALAIGALAPAFAASGRSVQHIALERQLATGAVRIGIDGSAPAGCVPRVDGITVEGADISIMLNASATGCKTNRLVPFHLKAEPTGSMGSRTLPAQVYHVRVYAGSGTAPHLTAFALIDASAPSLAPVPESGFWWTQPDENGTAPASTGMSLELQDNQLAASLLGFTDAGASTWYFGSSTLAGRIARIPLVQLANGEEWFSAIGSQPDVQPGPRLEIEFISPARARAYLVRSDAQDDVQVRALTLSRSAFSTGPAGSSWVGRWVLVPEDGGATRLFDFAAPSHRDAESFRLVDTANDASLECRLAAGTPQADACTLTTSAATIADFDQVGYDHFAGHGANGAPVQLLRVPR